MADDVTVGFRWWVCMICCGYDSVMRYCRLQSLVLGRSAHARSICSARHQPHDEASVAGNSRSTYILLQSRLRYLERRLARPHLHPTVYSDYFAAQPTPSCPHPSPHTCITSHSLALPLKPNTITINQRLTIADQYYSNSGTDCNPLLPAPFSPRVSIPYPDVPRGSCRSTRCACPRTAASR